MTKYAYCRSKPIRSVQYLGHQSRHARREDETSKPRIRDDADPGTSLSWSVDDAPRPDYAASFRALKKSRGASERKGAQLGIHILVGVSPEWICETGDLHDPENPRNQQLLDAAKAWADTWSNNGTYAARLDLDETGGAVVDLFIAPLSEQKHKSGKSKLTVSVNKALEVLSMKHTSKKSKHFSALNTDWAEYASLHLDHRLQRGRPKDQTGSEHIGPDRYRELMQEAEAERDAARRASLEAQQAQDEAWKATEDAWKAQSEAKLARKQAEAKRIEAQNAIRFAAEAAAAVITGGLYRTDDGNWTVSKKGPDLQKLKPVFKLLRPALDAVADWWSQVRLRVDALPDPETMKSQLADINDPFLAPTEEARDDTGPGFG